MVRSRGGSPAAVVEVQLGRTGDQPDAPDPVRQPAPTAAGPEDDQLPGLHQPGPVAGLHAPALDPRVPPEAFRQVNPVGVALEQPGPEVGQGDPALGR